jgi:hypothetical protein
VLARRDRRPQGRRSGRRDLRVEVDLPILQRGRQIGGPAIEPVALGDRAHALLPAPHQHELGHQPRAVAQRDPALLANGQQRAHEVLPVPHPPGHPVDDDPDPPHRR